MKSRQSWGLWIISLLIIAQLIFFIGYKQHYTKQIHGIKEDVVQKNNQLKRLEGQLSSLENTKQKLHYTKQKLNALLYKIPENNAVTHQLYQMIERMEASTFSHIKLKEEATQIGQEGTTQMESAQIESAQKDQNKQQLIEHSYTLSYIASFEDSQELMSSLNQSYPLLKITALQITRLEQETTKQEENDFNQKPNLVETILRFSVFTQDRSIVKEVFEAYVVDSSETVFLENVDESTKQQETVVR